MNGILTVAGNTIWRTIKKPLVPLLFLLVPLLYFMFLKGSTNIDNTATVPIIPGGTCLDNTFLAQLGGIETVDKECFVFFTMIMFYYAVASFHSFVSDIKAGVARRVTATPVGPLSVAVGKWLAHICLLFVFSIISIVIGATLFNLHMGDNYIQLISTLFFFTVLTVDVGIILTTVLHNIYLCCLAVFVIDFLMMFTAMFSLFAPLEHSAFFSSISVISLNMYSLNAITGSVYAIAVLGIASAVGSALALLVGRRALR